MEEVPEDAVERAEGQPGEHGHEDVASEDGTLRRHLEKVHGLEVPDDLSGPTQVGLHDRVHGERGAADD